MTTSDELIPVGKIISTHGIRGLLKVFSYSGNLQSLKAADFVTLKNKQGALAEHAVTSVSAHGGAFIVGLDNYVNINDVQFLIGSELCLRRSQLPATDDDEYYWRDLIGLTVVTDIGLTLGTLVDIFETGSNDIYVVKGTDKEYLIPAIADVITCVDVPGGTMVITPLDGLLDL